MKTRFEMEEEDAARCDARCFFLENPEIMRTLAKSKSPHTMLDFTMDWYDRAENNPFPPYANHDNCHARDIFRETLLELMKQL